MNIERDIIDHIEKKQFTWFGVSTSKKNEREEDQEEVDEMMLRKLWNKGAS